MTCYSLVASTGDTPLVFISQLQTAEKSSSLVTLDVWAFDTAWGNFSFSLLSSVRDQAVVWFHCSIWDLKSLSPRECECCCLCSNFHQGEESGNWRNVIRPRQKLHQLFSKKCRVTGLRRFYFPLWPVPISLGPHRLAPLCTMLWWMFLAEQ